MIIKPSESYREQVALWCVGSKLLDCARSLSIEGGDWRSADALVSQLNMPIITIHLGAIQP